jgi:hypothetical protein
VRRPAREDVYPPDEPVDAGPGAWSGPVYSPGDPRGAARGRTADPWRIDPAAMLPTAVRVVSLFGCLRRLVVLAIVLIVLAFLAFYALFGVGGVFSVSDIGASPPTHAAGTGGAATLRYRTGSNSGELIAGIRTSLSAVAVGPVARAAGRGGDDVWIVRRGASRAASHRV